MNQINYRLSRGTTAVLDIKFIREHHDKVRKGAVDKRIAVDIDQLLELDRSIRPKQTELEKLQESRNSLSKTIGKAQGPEQQKLKEQVGQIKVRMDALQEELKTLKDQLTELLLTVPQPARADVPIGKDDKENVEVKRWGSPKELPFKIKDHVELGKLHRIIDIERGVKLAGSRSYILLGDGARLEAAILRYTFDRLCARGFLPLSIPVLVKEEAMIGTGYFPTGREQAYWIEKDQLALVGTAEVSLTSFRSDEILKDSELPIKVFAQSSCFRREAGTYGKDTQGLYRVHYFQKLEQVIVGPADEKLAEDFHNELLTNAEGILQDFGLPYRVVYVCTGDLGLGQVRKHDIETWMPSRGGYSETHSCSTFHDFQARRLKLRYRDASGEVRHCFTFNNTAIATPRILIPLLEYYQQSDGSILIPECLQLYMGGQKKIG